MDPRQNTNDSADQIGDIDPLELEDQDLQDEEIGEFAHIDEGDGALDGENKVIEEEQALAKDIDAVAVPDLELEADGKPKAQKPVKKGKGKVAPDDTDAPVKKTNQMIPQELIERPLTFTDLIDEDGTI